MTENVSTKPWEELAALLESGDSAALPPFLGGLEPGEAARALSHLDGEERSHVLQVLSPENAAALLAELPTAQAADMVDQLRPEPAAAIVEAMGSQERSDVLGVLEDAEAVLGAMAPEAADAARRLASYAPETAGGLMATEFLAFPDNMSVGELLRDLRQQAERYADYAVQYVYVVDEGGRLVGVLRLRDLVLAPEKRSVADLAIRQPLSVTVAESLDGLENLFERQSFFGVPVVDEEGVLVGIVRRGDVFGALEGRAQSDHLKTVGIVGGEELRSLPTGLRSRRRLAWLSINVFLNVAAASVIAGFQDTLSAVIALAVFLPIISDMSGCSGSQAVAVTMRELSLGLVKPQDAFFVLRKEASVGLINGLALGMLLAVVAWGWKGNPWLGLVVGVALAFNTVLAVCLGGAVPLLLKRMGRDPALASGPILTTCTDACGFFAVLGLATLLLPRLV